MHRAWGGLGLQELAVVLGLVGWWMGVTVGALLYYTSYYHYVFCSRCYYYYYYYCLRGCIFEALSIKLIFPPSRLGLPWSVPVDQEGDEAGTSGRHSLFPCRPT